MEIYSTLIKLLVILSYVHPMLVNEATNWSSLIILPRAPKLCSTTISTTRKPHQLQSLLWPHLHPSYPFYITAILHFILAH
jgi:hypothetical protein